MRTVEFTRTATAAWEGGVVRGTGSVSAGTGAFGVAVTFPSLRGEPAGATTPEELLAASHAVCFAIGLRSVIGRRGGSASRITVRATISAEKGPEGIRARRSHLDCAVEGLEGLEPESLPEVGRAVERECTISSAIRGNVAVSYEVVATNR